MSTSGPATGPVTGPVTGDVSGPPVLVPISDATTATGQAVLGTTTDAWMLYRITAGGQLERIGLFDDATYKSIPSTLYGVIACYGGMSLQTRVGTSYGTHSLGGCTGSGVGPWEVTKYELLRGEVTARRGGGQQVNGCGEPGNTSLCYTFADREAFKVSLERVAAKMKPSTDYLAVPGPGANVTVEVTIATPDDPAAPAEAVPFRDALWKFTPDAGGTPRTMNCYPKTCTFYAYESGYLKLTATVNGEPQEASIRVQLYTTFTLFADPTHAYVGEVAVFRPLLDGEPVTAQAWAWRVSGKDSSVTCAPDTLCVKRLIVSGAGVMTAYLMRSDGTRDSATATVQADTVPCPANDSLLDKKRVRDELGLMWDLTGTDGPMDIRREHGGYIYRNPDTGEIFAIEITSQNSICTYLIPLNPPQPPPSSWIIAKVHTHPIWLNDSIPAGLCPKLKPTETGKAGPPGPSSPDVQNAKGSGYDSYVIDRDSVYRVDEASGNIRSWPRQPNGRNGCDIIPPRPFLLRAPPRDPRPQRTRTTSRSSVDHSR